MQSRRPNFIVCLQHFDLDWMLQQYPKAARGLPLIAIHGGSGVTGEHVPPNLQLYKAPNLAQVCSFTCAFFLSFYFMSCAPQFLSPHFPFIYFFSLPPHLSSSLPFHSVVPSPRLSSLHVSLHCVTRFLRIFVLLVLLLFSSPFPTRTFSNDAGRFALLSGVFHSLGHTMRR